MNINISEIRKILEYLRLFITNTGTHTIATLLILEIFAITFIYFTCSIYFSLDNINNF